MSQVEIILFGFLGGASAKTRFAQEIEPDSTVRQVLSHLQSSAQVGEKIGTVNPEALLVLVNGQPIEYLEGWETRLSGGDRVTFLIKAAGG